MVDVRDIADLQIRAMRSSVAPGQRLIGAGQLYWIADIARVLRERLPDAARRVPKRHLPNRLVKLSSLFDPVVRDRLSEMNKERPVSSDKARRELGWSPRGNNDAIIDAANSFIEQAVVRL